MLRRLLLLPMTLILFLLASIVAARVDVTRTNASAGDKIVGGQIYAAPYRSASAERIGVYYDSLRARGLDIDETKPLILARLEASPLSRVQAVMRFALVEIYGLEAMTDPAFRRIFRPQYPRSGSRHRACMFSLQQLQFEPPLQRSAQEFQGVVVPRRAAPVVSEPIIHREQ